MDYEVLKALLNESEPTREALSHAADQHEQENLDKRGLNQ
jgi:hypothetical protein